jgi:enoyl-CoA hydratase/carnithine racemase
MLSGKLLSGSRAAEWGLVNEAVAAAGLDAAVDAFVGALVDKSPTTLWLTKMTVDRSLDADTESLMVMEHLAAALVMKSDDALEGVAAFLDKREPVWKPL